MKNIPDPKEAEIDRLARNAIAEMDLDYSHLLQVVDSASVGPGPDAAIQPEAFIEQTMALVNATVERNRTQETEE